MYLISDIKLHWMVKWSTYKYIFWFQGLHLYEHRVLEYKSFLVKVRVHHHLFRGLLLLLAPWAAGGLPCAGGVCAGGGAVTDRGLTALLLGVGYSPGGGVRRGTIDQTTPWILGLLVRCLEEVWIVSNGTGNKLYKFWINNWHKKIIKMCLLVNTQLTG